MLRLGALVQKFVYWPWQHMNTRQETNSETLTETSTAELVKTLKKPTSTFDTAHIDSIPSEKLEDPKYLSGNASLTHSGGFISEVLRNTSSGEVNLCYSDDQDQENNLLNVVQILKKFSFCFDRIELESVWASNDKFAVLISTVSRYMEMFENNDSLQFLSIGKFLIAPSGSETGNYISVSGRIYLSGDGTARNKYLSLFLDFYENEEIEPGLEITFYAVNPTTKEFFRKAVVFTDNESQTGVSEILTVEEFKLFVDERDKVLIGAQFEWITSNTAAAADSADA